MTVINVLGTPSSAGSFAAGQEHTPAALRAAGLAEALRAGGHEVRDHGDTTVQTWTPDREAPTAQNLDAVVGSVTEAIAAVEGLLDPHERLLLLGGNCTFALAPVAALRRRDVTAGLIYLDRHFDLNTPRSTDTGAFDWMGLSHGLALEGAARELVAALGKPPLLRPDQLVFLGVDPAEGTEWEVRAVERLGIAVLSQDDLTTGPASAAQNALGRLPARPFCVHIDVDVLDFTDAPIADSFLGRNSGATIGQLEQVLTVLCQDRNCRAVSIGGLNAVHAEADPTALPRFVQAIARAVG